MLRVRVMRIIETLATNETRILPFPCTHLHIHISGVVTLGHSQPVLLETPTFPCTQGARDSCINTQKADGSHPSLQAKKEDEAVEAAGTVSFKSEDGAGPDADAAAAETQ